jgi:hypothetical protein
VPAKAATAKTAPQLATPPARMAGIPNSGCHGHDGVAAVRWQEANVPAKAATARMAWQP